MPTDRAPKVVFFSGSIGLGHATRDLAIAAALRRIVPDVEIMWLAAEPARSVIVEAGETILAESAALADETAAAEEAARGFGLSIPRYLWRTRRAWKQGVATFEQVTATHPYDVLVGDETYEIAVALHRRPGLKKTPFVVIYDFVGLDAMTRSPAERVMVYAWNRTWCGGRHMRAPSADRVLFVGEPEDVSDRAFGPGLPNRRDFARRYYEFVGYVLRFDPAQYADRPGLRAALGYDDRPLIVCAVGGTSVGAELLQLCADAHAAIRERVPDVRMVLVCGPRVDPARVSAPAGVEVRGYVPDLHEHFAAADLAIVQGGGTTTLELTALRRPFISFALEGHCEQEIDVAARLARHGAGEQMRRSRTTPEALASAAVRLLASEPDWPAIPADGAARAAGAIASEIRGVVPTPAARPEPAGTP